MSMTPNEINTVEILKRRLAKVLPDLKAAQECAKELTFFHNWDLPYAEMAEAYITLADAYIGVLDAEEEEIGEN